MFMHTFDSTNQIASNPPARKKRLFGGSTLDHRDLFFKETANCPLARKKHLWSSPQRSIARRILKDKDMAGSS
jgi:hypothetical protein